MTTSYTPLDEIPKIYETLKNSYNKGVTRSKAWRVAQLQNLRRMMTENEEEIVKAVRTDLRMDQLLSRAAEVLFPIQAIDDTLENLDNWMKPESRSLPLLQFDASGKIHHDPYGLLLFIAPWNYPISLIIRPLAGAIAAGNCVIIKPSEISQNSSELLGQLFEKYMDPKCIRVVQGAVNETTSLLKLRFDKIMYTGNGVVAKIVMQAAAQHLTPVTLELGGKNPLIVDKDVDLSVAMPRILWGKFVNIGQTCLSPDYVLCAKDKVDEFITEFKNTVKHFYGEDPSTSPDWGKIINSRHTQRVVSYLKGGKIVHGGKFDIDKCYIEPTLLTEVDLDSSLMNEEVFGPLLSIIPINNMDEAISFVNSRPKPLALYIFSNNKDHIDHVLGNTSSGGCGVNECISHAACLDLPFGGVGDSGMGAYNGKFSFDEFCHRKSVLSRSLRKDPKFKYPPYNETSVKRIVWLLGIKGSKVKNIFFILLLVVVCILFFYYYLE
eukprot:TRINITY_DN11376_c0_g1_i1.p1 TRINITY_DN11376_c0_g1~~TRINITY_DN11376_c0_g1_i1.p1  ORF type:complete len:493 (+),score=86.22 TRINITY_DN11376_c0_g1_i1:107-1585(+)